MKLLKNFDFFLLVPVFGIVGISMSLIASTSPDLFPQHLALVIIGLLFFIFISSVDYRIWSKFIFLFYILSLILLITTFFGHQIRGSSRWIDFGFVRIQPSELVKPFIVLILAAIYAENKKESIAMLYKPLIFFLPLLFIIFKQPDLGNVLVYLFIFITITFVSGIPLKYMLTGFILSSILLPLSWLFLKEYQKTRILSFLDPGSDPIGAGYNAIQAIIAIGSGQLLGLGLGRGTQSHLLFLPEYHTDFIFASLAEELGFIGGVAVLILYTMLLGRILYIAYNSKNSFARILSIGVFSQLFIQVFINIGMNLGVLPITGITLPLLSYGGSSIISTFASLAVVSSISSHADQSSPIVLK